MLLDHDDQLFLGKLSVGTAIVKLQNRWQAVFMVKLPYMALQAGKISDNHMKSQRPLEPIEVQNARDTSSKLDSAGCSAQNVFCQQFQRYYPCSEYR